jgi:membrane fusion protein (multidrug efflux system)
MSLESSAQAREALPRQSFVQGSSRRRITLIAIAGVVLVVVSLVGIKAVQIGTLIKTGKSFVPPPESVASAKAETADWQTIRAAIGSLVAIRGVTLGAEITGAVREISFDSGTFVKKGAILVKLDTSTEQAQLESARADAAVSALTLRRHRDLRPGGVSSQADLDNADAKAKQTNATVASLEATLAKKTIRAPFDGRIAIRQIELGQILSPGTPIASLQSVSPIYAEFSLPQQALADLKLGQQVQVRTDTFPGSAWQGEIAIINPEVDVATRNVRIRATINNPDGRLTPGMFVNVEVLSGDKHTVTLIPATSIIYAPYGDSVYVLEDTKNPSGKTATVARQRFVRLGEHRGDYVAVISGLTAAETVVSSGAFKLRNGMPVTVNNSVAAPAEIAPKPTDN